MFLAFIFCCTSPNAAAKAVADKPCACVVRSQVARSPWAARTRMTRAARRRSWERKIKVSCHLCDLLCSNFFTVHAVSYRCLLTVTIPNAASHKARKTACTSCFTVLLRLGKVRLHCYICLWWASERKLGKKPVTKPTKLFFSLPPSANKDKFAEHFPLPWCLCR